jgi:hypothetical protein
MRGVCESTGAILKKYTIKLPNYERPFPYITDIPPEEVPEAIFQRFRIYPEWVR